MTLWMDICYKQIKNRIELDFYRININSFNSQKQD